MRHFRILLLVSIFITPVIFLFDVAQAQDYDADKLFEEARKLAFGGKRDTAIFLCGKILTDTPDYDDVRVFMGRVYAWEKLYDASRAAYSFVLKRNAFNREAWDGLLDTENWSGRTKTAIGIADGALEVFPDDENFLFKKALLLKNSERWVSAKETVNKLLRANPNHVKGKNLLEQIQREYKPYSISVHYQIDAFNKIFAPWHFSFFQLGRNTRLGSIFGRINYANRYKLNGVQYEIDLYPKIKKGMYMYLNVGYSNNVLFPKYRYGFELFSALPLKFESSLGLRHLRFDGSSVMMFTGSVSKYFAKGGLTFNGFVTPQENGTSLAFLFTFKRHIKTENEYWSFILGSGNSPDSRSLVTGSKNVYFLKSYHVEGVIKKNMIETVSIIMRAGYRMQELDFAPGDYVNRFHGAITLTKKL